MFFHVESFDGQTLTFAYRTLFSASRFRLMASGSCLVQKTGVFSSGTPRLVMPNSCFKDIRTLSFPSHPVLFKAVCLLLEVETCVREFGGSFHSAILTTNDSLTDDAIDSRDTTPLAVERLRPNDRSGVKFSGYLRTLFSISFSFAQFLVIVTRLARSAATWQKSAEKCRKGRINMEVPKNNKEEQR